jgi:hypothetical protein
MVLGNEVHPPTAPSERRAWLTALALLALGVGVLVAVLGGALDSGAAPQSAARPPAVLVAASTPTVAASAASRAVLSGRGAPRAGPYAHGAAGAKRQARPVASAGPIVASSTAAAQTSEALLTTGPLVHIPAAWEAGFYPIYAEAQRVFGVNWLLLASIHDQETAFSTAPGTYHGLNFAHCCGGPMQFNVTNGPVSTWQLVENAYRYGKRPASYDHRTAHHPSIYDDFDAIMAAAWLLSSDGAGPALDDSAWWAAYDYYGHGAAGVTYADQVLARAISWSQRGFCINCGLQPGMVNAVQEAYGAPVLESVTAATLASARHDRHRRAHRGSSTR